MVVQIFYSSYWKLASLLGEILRPNFALLFSDENHRQNSHLLKFYQQILFLALFGVRLFSSHDTNRTVLIQSLPKNYLRYIRNFA